jgi:hypothetical protein
VKRFFDSQNSNVKKESSYERLLDSKNSIVKKEKVRVKGFMIARILPCERKIYERLSDSRNSIMKEEKFVKRLRDSQRHRESLKSHCQRDSQRKGLRQEQVVP